GGLPAAVLRREADRGQKAEMAEAPSERDRVIDGTAAGVEHHGRAAELAGAGKLLEIPGRISGDDADRADPAAAVRLAGDPAELHWQLALFEGCTGMSRGAGRSDSSGQRDAKCGGPNYQPAATIKGVQKSQSGS